jgi:two-component system nitrogen regulation sensor histidine kinase NtrY
VLEDHGGRIELKDAADFRPGQRGAWMRLRFAITGRSKVEVQGAGAAEGETKEPAGETEGPKQATNNETKIEAATGS